jgi:N-acetylneuraminic acid mutarotase
VLSAKVFSSRVAPDGTLEPWQAQASLPAARHALGAASHGDRLFAIGGEIGVDPGNSSATTEVLATTVSSEGALGGWSAPPAGTLAQARYFHATATTATHVYALGGATFGMALDTVLVGTLAPNGVTWTPGLSLPAARSRGAAIATHGSVYVVGGGEGTTCRSTILRAPILAGGALGAWQDEVNASFDAKYPALAVHGDHLYVLGGEGCASGLRQAAWVATIASDGSLGALQPTTALPQPRKGAGAFVAADRLYLVAGDDGGGESAAVHSSVVGADGQLGSWRPEEGLPDGAGFFGLVVR